MNTKEFVQKCGELLNVAKPNLVKCKLVKGIEIEVPESMKRYEHYIPDAEYVVVTCKNGYTYKINVDGNSLSAIAEAIFSAMVHK